jgi:hypothetical protein
MFLQADLPTPKRLFAAPSPLVSASDDSVQKIDYRTDAYGRSGFQMIGKATQVTGKDLDLVGNPKSLGKAS